MKELHIEKFSNSNQTGVKFSVISAGQCGGNIADVFAGIRNQAGARVYNCIAINTFSNDLKPLTYINDSNKLLLKGDSKGCGKNPKECEELFEIDENGQTLANRICESSFANSDAFIVCAGLGGGTGTGLAAKLVQSIEFFINGRLVEHGYKKKPIIAIISIPKLNDPILPIENAVTYLQKEFSKLLSDNTLNSLIIIDNNKAYNEYNLQYKDNAQNPYESWLDYSNKVIVQALHEINTIIMYPTEKNVDPSDLKNIIGGDSGTLNIGKVIIDTTKYDKEQLKHKVINSFLDAKVIAHTKDISSADSLAYFIVKPISTNKDLVNEVIDDIQEQISEMVPYARICESAIIDNIDPNDSNLYIYNLSKLSTLPQAVNQLSEEYVNKQKNRFEKKTSNFSFGNSSDLDKAFSQEKGTQQSDSNAAPNIISNPFAPKRNLKDIDPSQSIKNLFTRNVNPWDSSSKG